MFVIKRIFRRENTMLWKAQKLPFSSFIKNEMITDFPRSINYSLSVVFDVSNQLHIG